MLIRKQEQYLKQLINAFNDLATDHERLQLDFSQWKATHSEIDQLETGELDLPQWCDTCGTLMDHAHECTR